jgi:hypothetical protein
MRLLVTLVVVVALVNMSLADETVVKADDKMVEKSVEKFEPNTEPKEVPKEEPKEEPTTSSKPVEVLKPKRAKSPIHPLGQNRLNSVIGRVDARVETTTAVPAPAPRASNSSPVSFKSSHILALVPALAAIAKLF